MSMISEQVKELRTLASIPDIDAGGLYDLNDKLCQATDTIESLSAKLQAANEEQSRNKILKEIREKAQELSNQHWGDDERHLIGKGIQCMFVQAENIIKANMERSAEDCRKSVLKIETPKVCIDCPCHFAGESGMVMCGAEKRELLTDDIETFKPDWCLLRESVEDCGGWIPCKVGLPETRNNILICQSNGYVSVGYYSPDGVFLDLNSVPFENVAAWSELPEPYYEP